MTKIWMIVGASLVSFSAWGCGGGEVGLSPSNPGCKGANGPRAPVSILVDGVDVHYHKDETKPLDKLGCHKDDYGRYHCH